MTQNPPSTGAVLQSDLPKKLLGWSAVNAMVSKATHLDPGDTVVQDCADDGDDNSGLRSGYFSGPISESEKEPGCCCE